MVVINREMLADLMVCDSETKIVGEVFNALQNTLSNSVTFKVCVDNLAVVKRLQSFFSPVQNKGVQWYEAAHKSGVMWFKFSPHPELDTHCNKHLRSEYESVRQVEDKQSSHAIQIGGDHYKTMAVEPWYAMKSWLTPEEYIGFLRGNIIKYHARANSGKECKNTQLLKAGHYQKQLEEFLESLT